MSKASPKIGSSISPDSSFLNCILSSKRMLGGSYPKMRTLFETEADLGHVDGGKLLGPGPEKEAKFPCYGGNVLFQEMTDANKTLNMAAYHSSSECLIQRRGQGNSV